MFQKTSRQSTIIKLSPIKRVIKKNKYPNLNSEDLYKAIKNYPEDFQENGDTKILDELEKSIDQIIKQFNKCSKMQQSLKKAKDNKYKLAARKNFLDDYMFYHENCRLPINNFNQKYEKLKNAFSDMPANNPKMRSTGLVILSISLAVITLAIIAIVLAITLPAFLATAIGVLLLTVAILSLVPALFGLLTGAVGTIISNANHTSNTREELLDRLADFHNSKVKMFNEDDMAYDNIKRELNEEPQEYFERTNFQF